jgi:hypothetical protein
MVTGTSSAPVSLSAAMQNNQGADIFLDFFLHFMRKMGDLS